MDFLFHGQRIRESTGMTSKTKAKEALDKRKQKLRSGSAGIHPTSRSELLSTAAAKWRTVKERKWSPAMRSICECSFAHLLPVLGKKLLVDIEGKHIAKYQAARLAEGASNRSINIEVGLLRQIMRRYGQWTRIQPDVSMLPERRDVGRALTPAEERILLVECGRSPSRALLPFVELAIATGSRYGTIRTLQWGNIDFAARSLKFGHDKTVAGTGRTVPLNARAMQALQFCAAQFPNRQPAHYVFPSESYGLHGTKETFGALSSGTLMIP